MSKSNLVIMNQRLDIKLAEIINQLNCYTLKEYDNLLLDDVLTDLMQAQSNLNKFLLSRRKFNLEGEKDNEVKTII